MQHHGEVAVRRGLVGPLLDHLAPGLGRGVVVVPGHQCDSGCTALVELRPRPLRKPCLFVDRRAIAFLHGALATALLPLLQHLVVLLVLGPVGVHALLAAVVGRRQVALDADRAAAPRAPVRGRRAGAVDAQKRRLRHRVPQHDLHEQSRSARNHKFQLRVTFESVLFLRLRRPPPCPARRRLIALWAAAATAGRCAARTSAGHPCSSI